MLENKAQNSSGKQALRSTKFQALSRVIKEGYFVGVAFGNENRSQQWQSAVAQRESVRIDRQFAGVLSRTLWTASLKDVRSPVTVFTRSITISASALIQNLCNRKEFLENGTTFTY